jgi:ABC-2 type transport system ATP-binding protein
MIEARNLTKTFEDGTVAVRDATFLVRPGEVLGLLGPNGAGKTTTVHMLLGHLPPTSGQALLNGIDVHEEPLRAKAHVGYVSENVLLYGALTAQQNLRFFARLSGRPVPPGREEELLARVGLAQAARRRVDAFSKGMRQRLGIAIALVKDPPALVMDEPTSGLDPRGAGELGKLILDLRGQGKAILLVTHDVFRIGELCTHAAIVTGGRSRPVPPQTPPERLDALYAEVAHG